MYTFLNMKKRRHIKVTNLGRYIFRWLNPYGWVPFPGWQDCHLIEEFINPSNQIISVFSFISNIMENL